MSKVRLAFSWSTFCCACSLAMTSQSLFTTTKKNESLFVCLISIESKGKLRFQWVQNSLCVNFFGWLRQLDFSSSWQVMVSRRLIDQLNLNRNSRIDLNAHRYFCSFITVPFKKNCVQFSGDLAQEWVSSLISTENSNFNEETSKLGLLLLEIGFRTYCVWRFWVMAAAGFLHPISWFRHTKQLKKTKNCGTWI